MYRISACNDEYNTYLMEDGENQVRVFTKRGGIVMSFVYQGREIFYSDPATVSDWSKEVRGGIPVLFPACGRLKEGPYQNVKKHGFVRDAAWKVTEQNTDGAAILSITVEDTEETRKTYPHRFRLTHTHILKGNTLTVRQTVTNTGDNPMPFSLGLHPYFNVDPAVATASVPSTDFEDVDGKGKFDGTFAFCNDYDSVCSNLTGNEAVLETGLGYRIRVIASDLYRYFVVWSPNGAQFACVEPWTAPPNALNSGVDLITVSAGETVQAEMQIVVE